MKSELQVALPFPLLLKAHVWFSLALRSKSNTAKNQKYWKREEIDLYKYNEYFIKPLRMTQLHGPNHHLLAEQEFEEAHHQMNPETIVY